MAELTDQEFAEKVPIQGGLTVGGQPIAEGGPR